MTLIRTLTGPMILDDLQRAYVCLARAFLFHRAGGCAEPLESDPVALDGVACSSENRVDLREARRECDLIETDYERRPIEVFNNLCHIFVILQPGTVLRDLCAAPPTVCAPAQQSSYEGVPVPDLKGEGWLLEAFGGQDVVNNGKLAKDLRKLSRSSEDADHLLLAIRRSAWTRGALPTSSGSYPVVTRCSRHHGGPFSVRVKMHLVGEQGGVAVLEAREILVEDG